ncbi:MAG: hypothetical protein ACR2K2_08845 [Mycobacteriales bacterium]
MSAVQGPNRRSVLTGLGGAAATLALTGCTSEPAAPPPPDPDDLLREAAVAREQSLLRAYDGVLLAQPTLTARLLPLREQHVEHLAALTAPTPPASAPAAGASAGPAVPPPPTTVGTLDTLAAAERAAGVSHAQDALAAVDRPLAALLATLSASEQSHPVALA